MSTEKLEENILSIWGERGRVWLQTLPDFLSKIKRSQQIRIDEPFTNLSYQYVAPVTDQEDRQLVLKAFVQPSDSHQEIAALKAFAGQGAVQLIKADPDAGWLLIARLSPGYTLESVTNDDEAIELATVLMQTLWWCKAEDLEFPTIAQQLEGLDRLSKLNQFVVSRKSIDRAIQMGADLVASIENPILLHGDLHHDNILRCERNNWVAIDPKGVVGERECDIFAFLSNPRQRLENHESPQKLLDRRLSIICDITGLDRQRVAHWCYVQAVLAVAWHIEDKTAGAKAMYELAILLRI